MAYANFRINANYRDNIISGIFISFDSCSCYQYGPYSFLKDWKVESLNYGLSSDQKTDYGDVVLRVTFEYTHPDTGLLIGDTADWRFL